LPVILPVLYDPPARTLPIAFGNSRPCSSREDCLHTRLENVKITLNTAGDSRNPIQGQGTTIKNFEMQDSRRNKSQSQSHWSYQNQMYFKKDGSYLTTHCKENVESGYQGARSSVRTPTDCFHLILHRLLDKHDHNDVISSRRSK